MRHRFSAWTWPVRIPLVEWVMGFSAPRCHPPPFFRRCRDTIKISHQDQTPCYGGGGGGLRQQSHCCEVLRRTGGRTCSSALNLCLCLCQLPGVYQSLSLSLHWSKLWWRRKSEAAARARAHTHTHARTRACTRTHTSCGGESEAAAAQCEHVITYAREGGRGSPARRRRRGRRRRQAHHAALGIDFQK